MKTSRMPAQLDQSLYPAWLSGVRRYVMAPFVIAVSGCAATPNYPIHMTEDDRQQLREWVPAFRVFCAADQARGCAGETLESQR